MKPRKPPEQFRALKGPCFPRSEITRVEPLPEKEQLALLLRVNAILNSSLSIPSILENLLEQVVLALGAERGFVLLRPEEAGEWQPVASRLHNELAQDQNASMFSHTIVRQVAEQGQALLLLDACQQKMYQSTSVTVAGIRSVLCAPLTWRGRVQGVVYADHRVKNECFQQAHLDLLVAIADQAARALENAALYEELQRVHESSMERAREELSQTQNQLWEASKLAAVGQLAAGVAHEVNNPLGALALNLTALSQKVEDPALAKRVDLMKSAVGRCKDIIDRLLRFAHPAAVEYRPLRLDLVLADSLALLAYELDGITAETDLQPVTIVGNATQLSQVALNLILNARDAMPSGHPQQRLEVVCRAEGKRALIRIQDSGIGMSTAVASRVFEPFFTTKEVGQGVGLGLSITYQVLQEHDAFIELTSQEGLGTTFELSFPLEEATCPPPF